MIVFMYLFNVFVCVACVCLCVFGIMCASFAKYCVVVYVFSVLFVCVCARVFC